jgi:hypothetical protein
MNETTAALAVVACVYLGIFAGKWANTHIKLEGSKKIEHNFKLALLGSVLAVLGGGAFTLIPLVGAGFFTLAACLAWGMERFVDRL